MKLEDILKKQQDKGGKVNKLKASTPSIDEYTRDKKSPRPYHYVQNPNQENKLASDKKGDSLKLKKKQNKFDRKNLSKKIEEKKSNSNAGRRKNQKFDYEHLIGNSKLIVDEIVRICLINGSLCTDFIDKKEFSNKLGVKEGSIKTTCVRLREKSVLESFEATKGRMSQWKFYLSNRIFEQAKKNRQY